MPVIVLVGTKKDLIHERKVSDKEIQVTQVQLCQWDEGIQKEAQYFTFY